MPSMLPWSTRARSFSVVTRAAGSAAMSRNSRHMSTSIWTMKKSSGRLCLRYRRLVAGANNFSRRHALDARGFDGALDRAVQARDAVGVG